MKKTYVLSVLMLSVLSIHAVENHQNDSLSIRQGKCCNCELKSLRPSYLVHVASGSVWNRNWFLEVKGGTGAFIGSPLGCGDLFDRMRPVLQAGLGKWLTPSVGGRVGYQGISFKNMNLQVMDYSLIHADFLYNATGWLSQDERGNSRWDIIPFVGVGMIQNHGFPSFNPDHEGNSHPLAFTYGVESRYRLGSRWHLIMELSGMTTFRSFDGVGVSDKFGDHLPALSAGLSLTIGKAGWKRVIDARPYIHQNDRLRRRIAAMRKCDIVDSLSMGFMDRETNEYQGLRSLRKRISLNEKETQKVMDDEFGIEHADNSKNPEITDDSTDAVRIGQPIFFYFQLNTNHLVDDNQLDIIDQIASLAKDTSSHICITGAADSATGTKEINEALSKTRASFIAKELLKRGVPESRLQMEGIGGISDYSPIEANRNACVVVED